MDEDRRLSPPEQKKLWAKIVDNNEPAGDNETRIYLFLAGLLFFGTIFCLVVLL